MQRSSSRKIASVDTSYIEFSRKPTNVSMVSRPRQREGEVMISPRVHAYTYVRGRAIRVGAHLRAEGF